MRRETHQSEEILRTNGPLIRRIVTITSQRRRLSESDKQALSEVVESKLAQPDADRLGRFQGASSLRSYLSVVVQTLCQTLTNPGGADTVAGERSHLAKAIRQATSTLPSREALVVKMWFESGMTTQKIVAVLGMHPTDVHAVIAKRTDSVQNWLAQSRTSPRAAPDAEETP